MLQSVWQKFSILVSISTILPPIPDEVIEQIMLLLLPVKSLLRFKCVCKRWRECIESAPFVKKHLHLSTPKILQYYDPIFSENPDSLCVVDINITKPKTKAKTYLLKFYPDSQPPFMFYSCNGLLLLGHYAPDVPVQNRYDLILQNPHTTSYYRIPLSDIKLLEPSGTLVCGLWYEDKSEDYKVYLNFQSHLGTYGGAPYYSQVLVYSLKKGSYEQLHPCPYHIDPDPENVFVGGTLNWLLFTNHVSMSPKVILSFDVSTNKYGLIQLPMLPSGTSAGPYRLRLYDLGGCVSIVVKFSRTLKNEVWVFKDHRDLGSWCILFSFFDHNIPTVVNLAWLKPLCYSICKNYVLVESTTWTVSRTDHGLVSQTWKV